MRGPRVPGFLGHSTGEEVEEAGAKPRKSGAPEGWGAFRGGGLEGWGPSRVGAPKGGAWLGVLGWGPGLGVKRNWGTATIGRLFGPVAKREIGQIIPKSSSNGQGDELSLLKQ